MYASKIFSCPEKAGSQIEEAYWRLRQEIIAGHLQPGEKLRIEFLRKAYGFGASGIREALSRLLADGLVDSEAQRGFWVSQISREDLRDVTETRKVIEVEALRQAIRHGTIDWEARVVAARYALERVETSMIAETPEAVMAWERANRQFHTALISGCPLWRLLRLTEHLYDQSQRYRHRTILRRAIPRSGLSKDHVELVDASLKRDAERACAMLTDHIEAIAKVAEMAIFGGSSIVKRRARRSLVPSQRLKGPPFAFGHFDADGVAGPHEAACDDDRHHARLAHEVPALGSDHQSGLQADLEPLDLTAGIAQAGDLDHCGLADMQTRPPRQAQQIHAVGENVLSEVPRHDMKTGGAQLVKKF